MVTINSKNMVGEKILKRIRIVLSIIIIINIINRSIYSWNTEIPALFFFTVQSNLLLAVYWMGTSLFPKLRNAKMTLSITTYMVIVGIVFIFLLDVGFLEQIYTRLGEKKIDDIVHYYAMISSIIAHYIMPFLAFIDFILFTDTREIKKDNKVFIYPTVYFSFAVAFSLLTEKYIYPFLDPSYMGGVIWVVFIVFFLYIVLKLMNMWLHRINIKTQNKIDAYYEKILE